MSNSKLSRVRSVEDLLHEKVKNIPPQSKLGSVYYAIVESYLRYEDAVWGSLSMRKVATFRRLENRVQFIILSARVKGNWSCDWRNINNLIFCALKI